MIITDEDENTGCDVDVVDGAVGEGEGEDEEESSCEREVSN